MGGSEKTAVAVQDTDKKGLIVKSLSGFYYTKTGDRIFQCRARGIFKKEGITPCVGDYVKMKITDDDDSEGLINEILPRKNIFIRPPVSNIDTFVIVAALDDPEPNTGIIDKFLATAEIAEVEVFLVINKDDLIGDGSSGLDNRIRELKSIYDPIYKTITVSAVKNTGLEELKSLMKGKKNALIGPSGVGKTTIINVIDDRRDLETGEVSRKTGRGKNTTRHVEIYETGFGAYIFDTPGFTSFEVGNDPDIRPDYLFKDFEPYRNKCRFADCSHINEPGCAVRAAVSERKIPESRYDSYRKIREEWNG